MKNDVADLVCSSVMPEVKFTFQKWRQGMKEHLKPHKRREEFYQIHFPIGSSLERIQSCDCILLQCLGA